MFAALDEGYYLNLRKQSMKNSAKERIYWKKYKGKWKKTATKKEKTSNELEKKYNAIENQKEPTKAEKLAKETNEKTEQLNKETINELDDIKKGKELESKDNRPLREFKIQDIDLLEGEIEFGWYDGKTLNISINSIQKNPLAPKNSAMKNLTNFAEDLAKKNDFKNVRLEFGPVMNSRLKTDHLWAREFGYYFSHTTDKLGNSVITWEKTLN
jgi:hypothetical protein